MVRWPNGSTRAFFGAHLGGDTGEGDWVKRPWATKEGKKRAGSAGCMNGSLSLHEGWVCVQCVCVHVVGALCYSGRG